MSRLAWAIALVLCFVTLPVIARENAPKFESVPRACAAILRNLARENGAGLKGTVDWSAVFLNMEAIGYPEHIAKEKLKSISFDPNQALMQIREALGKPEWSWGDQLNGRDSRTLGERAAYAGADFLEALPYWNSLRGFDAAEAVYGYLGSHSSLGEDQQKTLSSYAPWWLRGPRALENAKRYFKATSSDDANVDASWVIRNLPQRQRGAIVRYLRRQLNRDLREFDDDRPGVNADAALAMLSTMPWRLLPADVKKYLEENWVDLDAYKPIRMKAISHVAHGYQHAGNCEYMTNGHVNTLGICDDENEDWHNSVLIKVQGQLVGSLKLTGDPSMIALRNVMDSDGRLVLAMGATYHVSKDIYESLPTAEPKNGHWRVVNLDQLQVHPNTFMLNENAWSELNMKLLVLIAQDSLSKPDLIEIMGAFGQGNYNFEDIERQYHDVTQFDFLRALEKLRRKLGDYR